MVTIDRISERDLPKYSKIFQMVYDLTRDFEGSYYKFVSNDRDIVVHELNNSFLVFEVRDGNQILLGEFVTMDDGTMLSMNDLNSNFYFDKGALIQEDMDTRNTQLLDLNKRVNGEDYDGYDGVVHYNQFHPDSDIKVAITYQQMCYEEHGPIYYYHIEKPFLISVTERAHLDKAFRKQSIYARQDYSMEDSPLGFNISAIRDYGLKEFLDKGSYMLHGTDEISRYSRIVHFGNIDCISPFSKSYTLEEMMDRLKGLGFNTSVPDKLFNIYNKNDEMYLLFLELSKEISKIKNNEENQTLNIGGRL